MRLGPIGRRTSTRSVLLLSRSSRLTTFVDVTVTKDGLRAYRFTAQMGCAQSTSPAEPLRRIWFADVDVKVPWKPLRSCAIQLLRDAARAFTDALEPQSTILLAVDDALANLPLHAVPLGDSAWGDVVSIGRIPAIGALRFTLPGRTWSGQSSSRNSNGDLPGAAQECGAIGDVLGVAPLIGGECTFDAVRSALDQSPTIDLVHLAVHGRADPGRAAWSSLLFAGQPPVGMPFADSLATGRQPDHLLRM